MNIKIKENVSSATDSPQNIFLNHQLVILKNIY